MPQDQGPWSASGYASTLRDTAEQSAQKVTSLTARQRNVLDGMLAGMMNKQIAVHLGIKEKTVKMHRASLLSRLGVLNSAGAVRNGVEAAFNSILSNNPSEHDSLGRIPNCEQLPSGSQPEQEHLARLN